jgi:hypothetical protein
MQPKLNAQNPDSILYSTEELSFTILGGIKLEGLDRLRVTLKIEVVDRKFKHYLNNPDIADLALRQNLDLYNDSQVEKLIRRTAERLEVGSSAIAKALADITNQLELYRLLQLEINAVSTKPIRKMLTPDETEAAQLFLSSPNLMQRTSEAIGESGLVGEQNNALLMYIIFTTRKREHPLHIVSLGSSGIGKTYLQEKLSELIPGEDKVEITTLSENAFYYFEQKELSHKLIIIEDLDGALSSFFPLRELQTKRKIIKRISIKDTKGNTKTISVTVEGPICLAGCTTKESIYEDNANRSFLIYLDESLEQDERIMQRQRNASAGLIDIKKENTIKLLVQNCQRILHPISIKNPFAPLLQLPLEVFKPRRSNAHYLAFIEAITFYHQYQREQKVDELSGEIFIESTLEDIAEANKLIKEILLRKSDELNTACRRYFEQVKEYLKAENKTAFTAKEIRTTLRTKHGNQKRYMVQLLCNNYIKRSSNKKLKGYFYEVVSFEEYETLKNSINSLLDDVFKKLVLSRPVLGNVEAVEGLSEQNTGAENELPPKNTNDKVNGSHPVQSPSEPLKPNDSIAKKPTVQKFTKTDTSPKKNEVDFLDKTKSKINSNTANTNEIEDTNVNWKIIPKKNILGNEQNRSTGV